MSISVKRVLTESSKFSGVTLLSKLLSLPVMVFLGRHLAAEQFGAVAAVTLILQYASVVSPGFTNASAREIAHYNGAKEFDTSNRVESVANSADFLFSCVVFVGIAVLGLFETSRFNRIGFITVAFIYLAERIKTYYFNSNYYRQRFNVNVVASAVGSLANPIVAVALVPFIREYALLVAPLAASISTTAYYVFRSEQRLRFTWDAPEAVRLLRVGFILSLGGIAFWAFRLVDRTAITLLMSKTELGYYFYATSYVLMALNILADFGRVLEAMLWNETAKSESEAHLQRDVAKMALFIACVGAASIPVLQIGYQVVVASFVPKFRDTARLFDILALGIYPALLCMVPNILLRSKMINKQQLVLYIYSGAALVGFLLDWCAIKLGYGLLIIASLSLIVVWAVMIILTMLIKPLMAGGRREFAVLTAKLLGTVGALAIADVPIFMLRFEWTARYVGIACGACLISCAPLLILLGARGASRRFENMPVTANAK